MKTISRKDKIDTVLERMRIPTLIVLASLALCGTLAFFATPAWPLLALMGVCTLIHASMICHYYFNGPWFYVTPMGFKVWWHKGLEPYYMGYIDSRIFGIVSDFHAKSSIYFDKKDIYVYMRKVQIYVMSGRIHALESVIGATQPGISTKFRYEHFDLALDHEIRLHLCHYLFPNRSEADDVVWMILRGIE
jgi:hypothetical protein